MPALVLLSLLGIAALLSMGTRRSVALCLVATVAGVVDVLFIAAMFGHVHVAARLVFFTGIAAALAVIPFAIALKRQGEFAREALSPAPVIFLAGIAAYWVFYGNAGFHLWDEFSHWGLAAKDLLLTHHLPYKDGTLYFQDYPPGTALFYYFFSVNSSYSERLVYWAFCVLLLAPLALMLRGHIWRRPLRLTLAVVVMLLLLSVGGCSFHSIYVDPILSVYFAGILFACLASEAPAKDLPFLIPAVFMLPLIKKSGGFLAIVCVAVIFADAIVRRIAASRVSFSGAAAFAAALPRRTLHYLRRLIALDVLKTIVIWALLLSAPFVSRYSWLHWVKSHELRSTFKMDYSLAEAARALRGPAGTPGAVLCDAFKDRLLHSTLGIYQGSIWGATVARIGLLSHLHMPRLTPAIWTGLILALFAFAICLARPPAMPARLLTAVVALSAAFAVYLFGLFSLYLYAFDSNEGPKLAQFERYTWTYLLAMALLAAMLLISLDVSGKLRGLLSSRVALAVAAAFMLFLYAFENPLYCIFPSPAWASAPQGRAAVLADAEFLRNHTAPADSVLIVMQECDAWKRLFMRYEIAPRRVEFVYAAGGRPGDQDPVRRFNISVEGWEHDLDNRVFSHVFIANADQDFWDIFGRLFPWPLPPEERVFRVWSTEDQLALLPTGQATLESAPSSEHDANGPPEGAR